MLAKLNGAYIYDTESQEKPFIAFLVIAFLFLMPVAFNPWGYSGYSLIKTFVLYSIALASFVVYGLSALKLGYIAIPKPFIPSMFVLASIMLSTVFSINIKTSIVGEYTRFEGLITWFVYFWMFYVGFNYFSTRNRLRTVELTIKVTAILISAFAILQGCGIGIENGSSVWGYQLVSRSFATLGNPSTLAAYLVLILPICLLSLTGYTDIRQKWLGNIAAAFVLMALATTLSIGGWLGALGSILTILLFSMQQLPHRRKAVFLLILMIAMLILGAVAIIFTGNFNYISDLKKSTAQSRILLWSQTFNLVKEKPLLGWGVDSFQLAFPNYLLARAMGGDIGLSSMGDQADFALKAAFTTDNAHNVLLHYASTTGLLGIVCLLWFFLFYVLGSRRYLRHDKNALSPPVLPVLAAIIGYGITLLSHFSTISVTPLLFFLLGVGYRLISKDIYYLRFKPHVLGAWRKAAVGMVCLGAIVLMAMPVVSDMCIRNAIGGFSAGNITSALQAYDMAASLHPWEEEVPFMKARHISAYISATNDRSFSDKALDALHSAKSQNDQDLVIRLFEIKLLEQNPAVIRASSDERATYNDVMHSMFTLKPNNPRALIR